MNDNNAANYYDPVSQLDNEYLKTPGLNSLRVIGKQYLVRVCASTNSPEYEAFQRKAQNFITKTTLGSLNKEGSKTKKIGKVLGGLDGAVNSTAERLNSTKAGMAVGEVPGKVFGSVRHCAKHLFWCSGKLALGGVVSALAANNLPKVWFMLNAHQMRPLADSMQHGGMEPCLG